MMPIRGRKSDHINFGKIYGGVLNREVLFLRYNDNGGDKGHRHILHDFVDDYNNFICHICTMFMSTHH